MGKLQILVASDCPIMANGIFQIVRAEKALISICLCDQESSLRSKVRSYQQNIFDLVIVAFNDCKKAPDAAIEIREIIPHSLLIAIVEPGVYPEPEGILLKVAQKILGKNDALKELPRIIDSMHEAKYVSILRLEPATLNEDDLEFLVLLQNRITGTVTDDMTRGMFNGKMRRLSNKMGIPNSQASVAVSGLRMFGDIQDTTEDLVLPKPLW
jgi:hypothetical protein